MKLPLILLFVAATFASAQEVSVGRVNRREMMSIEVSVRNTTEHDVRIPYCGDLEHHLYLCWNGTGLQVQANGEWQVPKTECGCLPGGYFPEKSVLVAPGESRTFVFDVAVELFAVRRGDTARVTVGAFPDEESMRASRDRTPLYSAPFVVP